MHESKKLPTCECGSNKWFVHTAIDPKGNYGRGCILEEFIVCQKCERRVDIYKISEEKTEIEVALDRVRAIFKQAGGIP